MIPSFLTSSKTRNIRTLLNVKEGKGYEQYRMWGWIKMEAMIIIPDNWLHNKREWAQVTLMDYGSNKLQNKVKTNQFQVPRVINISAQCLDKKGLEGERKSTCSKGSSVSSVEGGIRHERRILYNRS